MRFIAIIPARYNSKRLPGKPLALLGDKPVIQWVYECAAKVFDRVLVATDDARIADAVGRFGGNAVITGAHHHSGTSRVYEAYTLSGSDADVVVNVQGDEPFLRPDQLLELKRCFESPAHNVDIATLIARFCPSDGFDALADPNLTKVVTRPDGFALYFSRSVIPYQRGVPQQQWLQHTDYYTHIGVYAYRSDTLRLLVQLSESALQKAEKLEQLSWLQSGYQIYTACVEAAAKGIDTPADLERASTFYNEYIKN